MAKEIKNTILVLAIVLMDVAARIFKYNPELDEIFLTSDGQGFKSYEKAISHSTYLSDKKVTKVLRSDLKNSGKDKTKDTDVDEEDEDTATTADSSDDILNRDALIAEYTELYGKAPSHNIKTETLEARVAEAKANQEAKLSDDTNKQE